MGLFLQALFIMALSLVGIFNTDRALRRLTSEVNRDPLHSTRYGPKMEQKLSKTQLKITPKSVKNYPERATGVPRAGVDEFPAACDGVRALQD